MDIWTIVEITALVVIALLVYMKYGGGRSDRPLHIIPSGNPVLRIGTPPNCMEYNIEKVTPCVGFGWEQYGRQVAIDLKEPLIKPFGGFAAGERTIVIDDRLVTARTKDGDIVTGFEQKYSGDNILRIHTDYFEADMESKDVGELKRVLAKLNEETRERMKAQAKVASVATPEEILEQAEKIISKAEKVKSAGRPRYPYYWHYPERYAPRFEPEKEPY